MKKKSIYLSHSSVAKMVLVGVQKYAKSLQCLNLYSKKSACPSRSAIGRSMIEMLGVLAVIGVLSIIALVGFRMAMDNHQANVLLNDVRLVAQEVLQRETITTDASGQIDIKNFTKTTSFDLYAVQPDAMVKMFGVDAEVLSEGVCRSVLGKVGKAYSIIVYNENNSEVVFDGENRNICDVENKLRFLFNSDGMCAPSCPTCCYGVCCESDEICYEETHECVKADKCDWETENLCGNGCCAKGNSCCGGTCCDGLAECCGNVCCPSGQTCINNSCQCPGGKEYIDGFCQCPAGTVESGGVCRGVDCFQSGSTTEKCTTSGQCDCYIGSERCGIGCLDTGLNCFSGLCREKCIAGTTAKYHSALKLFGCWTANTEHSEGVLCTKETRTDNYKCYVGQGTQKCGSFCALDGTGCYYGDCATEKQGNAYKSKCDEFGFGYIFNPYKVSSPVYGCSLNNNIFAFITNRTRWSGIVEKGMCAYSCELTPTGLNNCLSNTCMGGEQCHAVGGKFNASDQSCCTGSLSCQGTDCICDEKTCSCAGGDCKISCEGVRCTATQGSGITCHLSSPNKLSQCGFSCRTLSGLECQGVCYESICTSAGLAWGKIGLNYGCYNSSQFTSASEGIACYKNGIKSNYQCFSGGSLCSTSCTGFEALGCEADCLNIDCLGGTYETDAVFGGKCIHPNNLVCFIGTKRCSISDYTCGTGCQSDGSQCSDGVCLESECPDGTVLRHNGGTTGSEGTSRYECIPSELSCVNGNCSISGDSCGSGCADDGTLCSTGICKAEECLEQGLTLSQVTYQYYGCYNQTTRTKCYRFGSSYVCYKNGSECGDGCNIDGTGCTSTGQTCTEQ